MTEIGRWIFVAGIVLVVVGALVMLVGKVPGLGKLPGDIVWEKGNFKLFAPLGTMLLLSIVLTILVNVIARLWK